MSASTVNHHVTVQRWGTRHSAPCSSSLSLRCFKKEKKNRAENWELLTTATLWSWNLSERRTYPGWGCLCARAGPRGAAGWSGRVWRGTATGSRANPHDQQPGHGMADSAGGHTEFYYSLRPYIVTTHVLKTGNKHCILTRLQNSCGIRRKMYICMSIFFFNNNIRNEKKTTKQKHQWEKKPADRKHKWRFNLVYEYIFLSRPKPTGVSKDFHHIEITD